MNSLKYWQELDRHLSENFQLRLLGKLSRAVAVFFAHSADSWLILIPLVLFLWRGPQHIQIYVRTLLIAICATGLLVALMKISFRRKRPQSDWGDIYRRADPHSFPSGHAARATLLAILILAWFPGFWAALLPLWALLVALARVALGVHFFSDILVGSILGVLSAILTLLIML